MLTVNRQNRYLLRNGTFFPYFADTAWTLLQQLSREEIVFYLDTRFRQGFNAVQVAALSELDGLRIPNREGQLPFVGDNPACPNPRYFELLLFLADECEKRDMVLTLLPTWGDKFNCKWGVGPEVFTPENAYCYGNFLATLLGRREQVIWMLGGDRPIETPFHREIIDAMAKGIRAGEAVTHLITYHPCGEAASADYLADAAYLDFHSLQSGHSFGGFASEKMVEETIARTDLPVLDAECFYEDFPIGFDLVWQYRFSAADIRKRMLRNMMAGALGHTYGHQSVWRFQRETDEEFPYDWKTALTRPMAEQAGRFNSMVRTLCPCGTVPSAVAKNAPARECETYAFVYTENRFPLFLELPEKKPAALTWWNAANGKQISAGITDRRCLTVTNPFAEEAICLIEYRGGKAG